MSGPQLSIRIDLPAGERIGPGKIALLDAIAQTGSISAAARDMGMSYRRAWLLVEDLNRALREPAVAAKTGGKQGGGATITAAGLRLLNAYRAIEANAKRACAAEFRLISRMTRADASS